MFTEGQLLYFTPFYFKNGNDPLAKFFIILKNIDTISVVASLPTKVDNAPSLINGKHGCIDIEERQFNCYVFKAGAVVCTNGFSFNLNTHVYGDQIDNYLIDTLTIDNSIIEGHDYEIKGELTAAELKNLKDCITNSKSIKRRVKKMLI